MATEVRWRRGTTAENDNFTGAEGEITVDMDKKGLRVHDNATQGGHPSLTEEAAHEAGYAYQVDSVSDLRSGSFPASLKRIWLAGYYGVGTAGGGPLYRDSDDTTTDDNGGTVFVDSDEVRWKRSWSGAVYVTWFGAKGDGSTDDGPSFRATTAISPTKIIVPEGTYVVSLADLELARPTAIELPDNCVFDAYGATLRLPDTEEATDYSLLDATNAENVTILGGTYIGNKHTSSATTGEHGMGLSVVSSDGLTVRDATFKSHWGDGIYVGRFGGASAYAKNVTLDNVICDDNRRQGMSVISVDGLTVTNSEFNNTEGTSPECGIDFEPNDSDEVLHRIRFKNVHTKNNQSNGTLFWMSNIAVDGVHLDIVFDNCTDFGSARGFYIGSSFDATGTGHIVFNNCVSRNSRDGAFALRNWNKDAPRVIFNNPLSINSTTNSDATSETENSAFVYFNTIDIAEFGGFEIHNYKYQVDGSVDVYAPREIRSDSGVKNVKITGFIPNPSSNLTYEFSCGEGNELSMPKTPANQYWPGSSPVTKEFPASRNNYSDIRDIDSKHCIVQLSAGFTGTSNEVVRLTRSHSNSDYYTELIPPDGEILHSGGLFSDGMHLSSGDRDRGSYVEVRLIDSEWHLVNYLGPWSAGSGP